jgi:uncharacterized membrane protein YfcA
MLIFNGLAIFMMLNYHRQAKSTGLSWSELKKLTVSGIIAFFADTIGMGSFAVNIFLAKTLNTFEDAEFPAMTNLAQVIPGLIEALFFLTLFQVDMLTLLTLVLATCIGGVLGGLTMTRLNKQPLCIAMMAAFMVIIVLLLLAQFDCLPMDGSLTTLRGLKLFFGFVGLVIAGSLTAAGVGLFVMVQAVLFMLNMSPIVAFPIMTIAGAMQQPLTAMIFLKQPNLPMAKIGWLSLVGCLGVFLGLGVVSHLNTAWLRWLLLIIVSYNFVAVSRTVFDRRKFNANSVTQMSEA